MLRKAFEIVYWYAHLEKRPDDQRSRFSLKPNVRYEADFLFLHNRAWAAQLVV